MDTEVLATNARRALIVFSSKRSTHHAFLEGVLDGTDFVYDNNVRAVGRELRVKKRVVSDDGAPDRETELYVASFEERFRLPKLLEHPAYRGLEASFPNERVTRLVFMRDPLNTLASTYSAHLGNPERFPSFDYVRRNVKLWLSLAKYVRTSGSAVKFVYANRFWADEEYKSATLRMLGAEEGATYSTHVSRFGGGGNTFLQSKRQAITPRGLQTRYLHYQEDPTFTDMVHDPENFEEFQKFLEFVEDVELMESLRCL